MTYRQTRDLARRTAAIFLMAGALTLADRVTIFAAAPPQFGNQQVIRPSVSARQLQQILARVRTDANALRTAVEQATPRGRATDIGRAAQNENTLYLIDDVIQSANELSDLATRSRVDRQDLDDLLHHASDLDSAMTSGQSRPAAATAWTRLRGSIDELASAYGMNWDWRNPQYARTDDLRRFTGTYRLSPADSDDPRTIADRALQRVASADRDRVSRQLENRLMPPDTISIERDNEQVTIESSTGPRTTFDANGQARTETGPAGRTVTTRAVLHGDELEVSTSGSGGSDFSVTFEPLDGGRSLSVTRRLYNDALRMPVIVRSQYHRTSETADWNVFNGRTARGRSFPDRAGSLIVPTGTIFVATLDQPLNVRNAREADRLSLTVKDAPNEFRNATIEGYVTTAPTRVSSRTGLSVAFDRLRLRDGRTADFAGSIRGIRDANGRSIPFDRAENVDNDDRTQEAIQRGAIGAAIGAVLGAVVGGGKGAAIGAVVGAGGGAGTVLIDMQTQPDLPGGTEFTIRSETTEFP
jgi:hypothetical protein